MPVLLNLFTLPNFSVPRAFRAALLALAASAVMAGAVHAAPPAPPPSAAAPDYGGRDSAPVSVGEAAPNPAAQAGRALEALVVVLGCVVGVVYVLKRFGLVAPGTGGTAARIVLPSFGHPRLGRSSAADSGVVTVLASQALPGGVLLHVVQAGPKTLVLAATAQTVTAVSEWQTDEAEALESEHSPSLTADFEGYLTRADSPAGLSPNSGIAAANARLRSLLSPQPPEEPS